MIVLFEEKWKHHDQVETFPWSITNVIQNNTGLYTKESLQQTFRIPNNNLDVRIEWKYLNGKI